MTNTAHAVGTAVRVQLAGAVQAAVAVGRVERVPEAADGGLARLKAGSAENKLSMIPIQVSKCAFISP